MIEWIKAHGTLFGWLTGVSIALLALSLILLPIIIVKLPADYFNSQEKRGHQSLALRIARNAAAWLLILAGVAMLILPGQGIIAILLGLSLADFPGKHKLQHWIVSRRAVLGPANWLRKKYGKPPLKIDDGGNGPSARSAGKS